MKTGSLRTRVALVTLSLLAVVLVLVVAGVTLAYRSSLQRDLRQRLSAAGAAVEQAGSGEAAKPLVAGLALEGIATNIRTVAASLPPGKSVPGRPPPVKPSTSIRTHGVLLVLDETLPDGTRVAFSASTASVAHSVRRLLLVEVLVALGAVLLAALLVLRGTTAALRPLSQVISIATRIAAGDKTLRLRPSRTDTELGKMAAAFDRMVDALESAVDRAESSNSATQRFLADASHELRTPVAALQATAETLLREQPERPERDRLEATLAGDAARLGRLIDDLLGLARLEAHAQRTPLDLNAVVESAAALACAAGPNAQIAIDLEDRAIVDGDVDSLVRLLRNLIDNALGAAATQVGIAVRRTEQTVAVHVTDDGPGIPDADRERIFERFVRLNPTVQGSGLGLAIARRIAREHGGDLVCDASTRGSSFTLHLPADSA